MEGQRIEKGFTRIPNELFEVILKSGFTLREQTIIFTVIRYTYGFNREETELSLRFIAKATDLHYQHVRTSIKNLINKNVLLVQKEYTIGNSSRVVSLNPEYESWVMKSNQISSSAEKESKQISYTKVTKPVTPKVTESVTKKENINKNLKKTISDPQTPHIEDEKNSKSDSLDISWLTGSYNVDYSPFNNAASSNIDNHHNENDVTDQTKACDGHTDIKNKKKAKDKDVVSLPAIPDDLLDIQGFSDIWENWITHRKEIKKPLTSMAAKLQLDKLLELRNKGSDVVELISTAIRNGWQGIWEVNNNSGGNYNGRNTENKGSLQSRLNYRFDPERYERERKEYIERYG